jgi:multiple sugar transport system substrate-binding protein
MKARKLFVVILACMLAIIPVTGCKSNGSASVLPKGAKPASVSLNYMYTGTIDITAKLLEFEQQFKQQNGINLKVKIVASSGDDWMDTVKTAVASGAGPDVWHMDVNWFSAWQDTVIQPLSPYYDKNFYDQFVPSAVNIWKAKDNYYAIPASYSVVAMLYNKKLVADAGITIGKTWTFDEFEQDLAKAYAYYKDKTVTYSGKQYPYYMLGTAHTMYYWWMTLGEFQGTPLSNTNNICQPAFVNSILKEAQWRSEGYVAQGSEVQPSSTQVAFSSAGNVVFWPTGDWTITALYRQAKGLETDALPVNVDYASIAAPTGPDGKSHAEVYNQGIVMNKNLKGWKAVAAADLIKFIGTGDTWEELFGPGSGGYSMPAIKTYAAEYTSWFKKPEQSQGFIDTIKNGVISSPDYKTGGIDLTSNVQEAVLAAINETDKEKGQFDSAKVKSVIESTLEQQQKLANTQMQEDDIKLDNPDATIK